MRQLLTLSLATFFLGLSTFVKKAPAEESEPADGMINSQERMEERNNNSSIIIESDVETSSDGQNKKDARNEIERKALDRGEERARDIY